MAQTLTEVANLALSVIGHTRINNLETDQQDYARTIRDSMETVLREEQADYPWAELRREVALQQASDQPDDESYVAYNIPADVLAIYGIYDDTPYTRVGDQIRILTYDYSVDAVPVLVYQGASTNPDEWSTWLLACIYTALASRLAMPLTQEAAIANMAENRYSKAKFNRDKAFKSSTSPVRRKRLTSWNNKRMYYGGYTRSTDRRYYR